MNVFDLYAKIALDTGEYEKGLEDASEKTSSFSDKLKTGLATAAKVGAAAIGAASTGIAALTKSSIDGYAEYEQLVGGVETLFKQSADVVQQYAANAYKTAGMSANEYMETVTSFSASLLQSLDGDTAAAAEKANLAITDMSDNANKMGTDMELIQNAYRGFAKSNYTMLDNLALGYGGTKEEMQRLLEDAEKISGIEYDISSYGDIVDAIHVVQTEMGITGTTAKEASTTISGSVSSMKSAWQNLVTGISDENANLEQLVGNFVDSAITAAGNIAPRIEQVLSGIGMLGEKIAPVIADGISAAVEKAPEFLTAGANMLVSLGNALMEQSALLIQNAFDLILVLADGLIQGVGGLADSALELVEKLAMWVEEYSDVLADKAVTLITTLANAIIKNLPGLIVAAVRIIGSLATGLIENLPTLIKQVPTIIAELVNGFVEGLPDIIEVGKQIVNGLWEGIKSLGSWLGDKVSGFFGDMVDGVKDFLGIHSPSRVFASIGEFMMEGLAIGMENSKGEVMETATDIIDEVKARFNSLADVLTARQDVSELGYKLWERTEGSNATEAEKYAKQLEFLSREQSDQESVVEAAAAAYKKVVEQYGDNTAESYKYQKALYDELLSLQDILDKVNEVTAAKEKLAEMETETVRFEDSGVAVASAGVVNGINSSKQSSISVPNAIDLTMKSEDGQTFGRWMVPFIRSEDKSNPEVVSDAV